MGQDRAEINRDEFLLMFPGLSDDESPAQTVSMLGEAIAAPICVSGKLVVVGASIGFSVSTGTEDFDEMVERADAMSYEVKRLRRNPVARV